MTKAGIRPTRKVAVGQRYNRLTVVGFAGHTAGARPKPLWLFRCDCGNELAIRSESVRSGGTKSCGCLKFEASAKTGKANARHGQSDTRIYRIWGAMRARCENPGTDNFEYYGGRGISVCQEWQSLDNFHDWALANGYADNLTIDRYPDQNGNYEPNNCRWVTIEEQQRNRRPPRKRKAVASS